LNNSGYFPEEQGNSDDHHQLICASKTLAYRLPYPLLVARMTVQDNPTFARSPYAILSFVGGENF
jgi:hypothetical protein